MAHFRTLSRLAQPLALLPLLLTIGCSKGPANPGSATRLASASGFDADVVELVVQRADLVDAKPEDVKRRVSLALAYEANSLWVEAEAAWDAALSFDPDEPTWLTHKGVALTNRGQIEEALACFERATALDPTLDSARFRLGLLQLQLGEDESALASFRKVVARQASTPAAHVGVAEALVNLEREQEAALACSKALELDPSFKRAHYVLGMAYRGLGRLEDAERELALGADSDPRFLPDGLSAELNSYRRGYGARIQDALDLVNAGKSAQAVPLLEKVVEGHPTDRVALVNLGVAYINVGRNSESIEVLKRAHDLDESDFAVLINLATAEMGLQRLGDALKHSEDAVRAAPNVSATYYMRSHAYIAHGRFGEAFTDLRKAASLDTGDPRYPIEAGDCAVRMGRNEEAIELYAEGLKLQPNSLPALVSMGVIADKLGRRSVAEDAYRRAKALQPTHERVIQLGQRLGLQ